MVEQDTVRLLKECDAGVKMGISSIDDILDDMPDGCVCSNAYSMWEEREIYN